MLTVRFIRHGESLANVGGVTGDPCAIPLTAPGQEQADKLSRIFNNAPDLIVSSHYARALDTAGATIARFPHVPFEIWPVHEIETLATKRRVNTTLADRRPWIKDYWSRGDPHYVDGPGAESYNDFVERVRSALTRLKTLIERPDTPPETLIFSHGQFMKAIHWEIAEASPPVTRETMQAFSAFHHAAPIANAEGFILRWNGSTWSLTADAPLL